MQNNTNKGMNKTELKEKLVEMISKEENYKVLNLMFKIMSRIGE